MAHAFIAFRPMTTADLPLIKRWLDAPHVAEWWGDPPSTVRWSAATSTQPDDGPVHRLPRRHDAFAYLQC